MYQNWSNVLPIGGLVFTTNDDSNMFVFYIVSTGDTPSLRRRTLEIICNLPSTILSHKKTDIFLFKSSNLCSPIVSTYVVRLNTKIYRVRSACIYVRLRVSAINSRANLNSINLQVLVIWPQCVLCDVQTEYL